MASVVDICNLALSAVGDEATVASIDPPEGSAQATHCARFYPMALRFMLDYHSWNFAVTRVTLNLLDVTPVSGWLYAYAQPSDGISSIALYAAGAADDSDPKQFDLEILPDGTGVIYTNEPSPVLKYVAYVSNPARFSPLFTDALVWLLASYLAGPILKGETGIKHGQYCRGMFRTVVGQAMADDANQRKVEPEHRVDWLASRQGINNTLDAAQNPWLASGASSSIS